LETLKPTESTKFEKQNSVLVPEQFISSSIIRKKVFSEQTKAGWIEKDIIGGAPGQMEMLE